MMHKNNDSLEETGMRYSETLGGYSIFIPKNWRAIEFSGLKYKMIIGPVENDSRLSLTFEDQIFRGEINKVIDTNIEIWKNIFLEFELIQQNEFVTLKNLKCKRVITKSLQNKCHVRQLFYFLYDNNKKLMVITCTSLIKNINVVDESDELIDKIINTFEWEADSEKYKFIFNSKFRNNEKNLEELRQNLKNVAPFFGAGISKNYGYPLWDGLLNDIINAIENGKYSTEISNSISKAKKKLKEKKYMDAIDILVNDIGQLNRYLEYILENISNTEAKRNIHKNQIDNFGDKLVLFPSKTYLTVNYDTVIENELNANPISKDNIEIFTPLEFIGKKHRVAEDKFQIYHLHGVYTQPETLIFSRGDYDDFYGTISAENALVRRFGEKIFELYATYCFLFIGYSFNFYQDRLYDILQQISKNPFTKCYHYAFLNTRSVENIEKKEKQLLGLKIKVIWYSANNNEQHQKAINALFDSIFNEKTTSCEVENYRECTEVKTIEPFTELQIFNIPLNYFNGDKYKISLIVDKMGKYYVTDNGETYKYLDNIFELKEYDVVKNMTAIAKVFKKANLSVEKYGQKESEYYIRVHLKNKENDADFNNEVEEAKYALISCISFMDNMQIFYV